jgi:hypothetical protein
MRQLMKRRRGSRTATPTTGDGAQRRRWLRLPTSTAALAVSIVALVVAMAGSAYAGVTLGKNSVGTKQLKKGAVTNGKIAKGAVGLGKLKTGLIVPNALHANVADSATNATNATNATKATSATSATSATTATTAANGILSFGSWAGAVGTIAASSSFTFTGPTTTLTTTAGQTINATSEASLGVATTATTGAITICKSPATGTPSLSPLDPVAGTAVSVVNFTTNKLTYAANGTGTPGAGTWKIGECVEDNGTLDNTDWALGYAFVVNGTPAPGSTAVKPAGGAPAHNG